MDLFSFFKLCGGLAFFLFGMNQMSEALSKMSGGSLEKTLKKITSNRFKALLLGVGVTAAIQSSSALTVMLVGLVNSGIMKLTQAIGVIMGSNIGTTMTAWILSLTGIDSDNFFVELFNPSAFSPILALIGIIMMMASKNMKKRDIGNIMISFAILMSGMSMMSAAVKPLAAIPEFANILTMFTNPILGVLAGLLVTVIIQSSSASVGILQAIALTGQLSFASALPIIMGQNIGTCISSVLSSIGTNSNAKRVAAVHVYFNIIGTVIFLAVFYTLNNFFGFTETFGQITPVGIAITHSVFNVVTTILLFPFAGFLEKLATKTIKSEADGDEIISTLDDRLLKSPAFALLECENVAIDMYELSVRLVRDSVSLLKNFDGKTFDKVLRYESKVDKYEDLIGAFLIKLSAESLKIEDSNKMSKLLHLIGDFERMGDHAENIALAAKELNDKKTTFSKSAMEELQVLFNALEEILAITLQAYKEDDPLIAMKVEPLEEWIDCLVEDIKARHIIRLKRGECTIELGFVLSELINNLERISDHCSNIALFVVSIKESNFGAHGYVKDLDIDNNREFKDLFKSYKREFTLPELKKNKA